ncbi:hypothetical protein QQP08_020963 [Theobroma cacao]|nr:hypothetical protein QQP08_020963 [Theobroma cacao]
MDHGNDFSPLFAQSTGVHFMDHGHDFTPMEFSLCDGSPFKDGNSINISVSIIAVIICFIAILVIYNGLYVGYHKTIINIGILSGSLAIISVLKILFPNLGWFFMAIWLALFACLALDSYKELFQFFAVAAKGVSDLWNTFLGRDQVNEGNNDQSSTTDHASA